MKKQLSILLILLFYIASSASSKPIDTAIPDDSVTSKNLKSPLYLKINISSTEIYKKPVYENALTVGVLMKNHVYVGGKISIFNDFEGLYLNNVSQSGGAYTNGGFLGICVEPFLPQHSAFCVSFPITFAGGMVSFSNDKVVFTTSDNNFVDRSLFLLIQPGIELHWNFCKIFDLGAGASYRHSSGLSVGDLPYDLIDGLNLGLSFRVLFIRK